MTQTVLAIDDSPDIHRLLDVRLRPERLVLHHALEAEEGLAMAANIRPDLILLDVDMPLVTGFEVCRKLKEHPALTNVPIIFLTGAAEVHTKVQGFDLGAVDYVTKPFEPAELRARVRAALRTKRYHDLLAARSTSTSARIVACERRCASISRRSARCTPTRASSSAGSNGLVT